MILLSLIDGKPPFRQERVCSMETLAPQPHVVDVCRECQVYLRARASWKAPLCRVNPNSSIGQQVSNDEAFLCETASGALSKNALAVNDH